MATIKQEQAFNNSVENRGNISKAMRDAGYDDTTAKNPKNLTESKGWAELVGEYLPDDTLTKVHKEGLEATLQIYKNNNATKQIELVDEKPDFAVRHKYLDTAYKIKGVYAAEKFEIKSINQVLDELDG